MGVQMEELIMPKKLKKGLTGKEILSLTVKWVWECGHQSGWGVGGKIKGLGVQQLQDIVRDSLNSQVYLEIMGVWGELWDGETKSKCFLITSQHVALPL